MFCAMFKKLLHPLGGDRLHICGKGGREGATYMMGHAISMLRAQGFTGDLSRILIVGDRFDTDILGGVKAGIRTCLVESGCHSLPLQPHFQEAPATFVAASIAELIPPQRRQATARRWKQISFDVCATSTSPAPKQPWPKAAHPSATSSAAPPDLARQTSDGSSASLRAWQLGHGNLVYSAGSGAMHGPLILMLRTFFEQHAARGPDAADNLPTVSAADALEAMRALGCLPATVSDDRPLLCTLPFDVTSRSRVTFAQLCREAQRALEASLGRRTAREFVFDRGAAARDRDGSPQTPKRKSVRDQLSEAPAVLQSETPGMRRRKGGLKGLGGTALPPCASDNSLETLAERWEHEARQPASRTVHALVDRRFLVLGSLPSEDR